MYSETSSYYSSSDSEIIENNEEQWQELVVDKDYEINTNNLYEIRRKGTNKKIKLTFCITVLCIFMFAIHVAFFVLQRY